MRFGGGRWDSGNLSCDDGRWKGSGWDVLSGNVALRISSKDSFNEGVLGGGRKEILLFVFTVRGLVRGDVGEDIETKDGGGRDGGASDDIIGAVWDVEEGVVLWVIEDWPSELGGWGTWDRNNG